MRLLRLRFRIRLIVATVSTSILAVGSAGVAASYRQSRSLPIDDPARMVVFRTGAVAALDSGQLRFRSASSNESQSVDVETHTVLTAPALADAVGVSVYTDRDPHALELDRFLVFDADGNRRIELTKPRFSHVIIAPTGNAFVGLEGGDEAPSTVLRFHDQNGTAMDSLTVAGFEGGQYCRDGSRFLFETAREGLRVCDQRGRLVHELGHVDMWSASGNGQTVVAARDSLLVIHRTGMVSGQLHWPMTGERCRGVTVSSDGQYAAAITATRAILIRVDSAIVVWERPIDAPEWNYRSVDVADGGSLIALGLDFDPGSGAERHQRSRCLILDGAGRVLHTDDGRPARWGAAYPQVMFVGDGSEIIVRERDTVRWLVRE